MERVEDAALLIGRGRFADDVGERPGTAHAAVLRSPHAHAEIVSLDAAAALSMPEVVTVLTGEEVAAWSRPFIAGVKQPMRHYALAVDRVRYTGEPVAVVVARDRYGAEDALERIEVEYRELDPVVDPVDAAAPGAPLLHRDVGSNVVSDRRFRYGDPDAAFASAAHRVAISVRYPRNACTPIEGFVVVAEHLGDDGYDVLSNFQGPFTLHPVMARALGVAGARLRLRSPRDSGGSFGVKQAVFPYVVAMCLASRKARCPVKWVEDRLEHLLAATSATNRVTTLEAAVTGDGTIAALRWDQLDDCGAYLRAPEPASLYRTHGHMSGPYRIAHLEIHNRVVLTNKTPTGLNRGFGGPQVYFALERLVHRIAKTLGLDPLDVIRRNLVPGTVFRVFQQCQSISAVSTLSVYASQPGSPPDHATLDSGWWPALTGQGSHLLGRVEGFRHVCPSTWLSPSPSFAWRNKFMILLDPGPPTSGTTVEDELERRLVREGPSEGDYVGVPGWLCPRVRLPRRGTSGLMLDCRSGTC